MEDEWEQKPTKEKQVLAKRNGIRAEEVQKMGDIFPGRQMLKL